MNCVSESSRVGCGWRIPLAAALLLGGSWISTAVATTVTGLPDFTKLVEQNSPAVVNISTRQKVGQSLSREMLQMLPEGMEGTPWNDLFKRFFNDRGPRNSPEDEGGGEEDREGQSLGSGFIIDHDGYVLTNNHVVDKADAVLVRLSDRREFEAKVVGVDPQTDIALLKIDADHLPVVKIGDSTKLKVGEWVMAIGTPFGFDHSVSAGVVSALGRSLPSENYVPFIQTDVAINPGNSGGPLFNLDGEVVGINSQIYSRTGGFMGLSFAIPMDVAQDVVRQLKESGSVSRGWLGVLIQDVTRELAESFKMDRPHGALVAQVLENSPALAAGIEVGDVIVQFNGTAIEHSSELPPLVGKSRVGKPSDLVILRNGQEKRLQVAIGQLPDEEKLSERRGSPKSPAKSSEGNFERIGLVVVEPTAEQRKAFQVEKGGVLVKSATGVAAAAGLRSGDLMTQFNNRPLDGVKALAELVDRAEAGRSVPILVLRSSGPRFLALKMPN